MQTLLFYHGRENYRRNTVITILLFYKNFLYILPLFLFGFYSVFSGQSLYDPVLFQGFGIIFTGIPCFWYGIADEKINKEDSVREPLLYWPGPQRAFYNVWLLCLELVKGTINSYLLVVICFYCLDG